MLSLHEVAAVDGHVVAEIVETELVVGSECDVGTVGGAACGRVGLMLVDAVNSQAVELVERAHPLGVSLGEVVVYGDHMDTLAGQRIQENRQSSHESLSLTGGHLGYLALMQNDTAYKLHVVVDHVPGKRVSACHPSVVPISLVSLDPDVVMLGAELAVHVGSGHFDDLFLLEPAGSRLHHCESVGQHLVENFLYLIVDLLGKLVHLCGQRLLFLDGDGDVLKLGTERLPSSAAILL